MATSLGASLGGSAGAKSGLTDWKSATADAPEKTAATDLNVRLKQVFNPAKAPQKDRPVQLEPWELGTSDAKTGSFDSNPPATEKEREVTEEKESLNEDRLGRLKVLGITQDESTGMKGVDPTIGTTEMTRKQYDKLSERARAAVDLNTDLADAIAADKAGQSSYKDLDEATRKTYDTRVENMFGEGRGSDTYAPNTLALLDQLKIEDTNADLDDYLGLSAGISQEDLAMLDSNPGNAGRSAIENPGTIDSRYELANSLVDRKLELNEALLGRGRALLEKRDAPELQSTMNATAQVDRQGYLGQLGATGQSATASPQMTGFNAGNKLDDYFQGALSTIANPAANVDVQGVIDKIRAEAGEDALDSFFTYANQRIQTAKDTKTPVGYAQYIDLETSRDADEVASLLGLGK